MENAAKIVLALAAVLALVGVILLAASRLGVERLPGDIVIRRDGFTLYAPIGVMILVSVIASIVLTLISRR
jgi:uncharacterized membrane protein